MPKPIILNQRWIVLASALLGAQILIDFALGWRLGFHLELRLVAIYSLSWLILLGLALFYAKIRPEPKIANGALATFFIVAYSNFGAPYSYIAAAIHSPLQDVTLASFDSWLGFDWTQHLLYVAHHPWLWLTLNTAYMSSIVQIILVLLILAATDRHERLGRFVVIFCACSIATITIFAFFPSLGAYQFHGLPEQFPILVGEGPFPGNDHLSVVHALREGSLRSLPAESYQGVIPFPSFHTVMACATVWVLWDAPKWRWPAVCLNSLVIVSTLAVGGHYLVDVLAGAAMTGAIIAIVNRLCATAKEAPKTSATLSFEGA